MCYFIFLWIIGFLFVSLVSWIPQKKYISFKCHLLDQLNILIFSLVFIAISFPIVWFIVSLIYY